MTGEISQKVAFQFMVAGKSEFILHSTKTNEDFKFRITKKKARDNENQFIYFLNSIDKKQYEGVIWFEYATQRFKFSPGKTGKGDNNNLNIRSLIFVLNKLYNEEPVQYLQVFHTGKCGKCGKKLTTPESIITGLGPVCCKNLGIPRKKIKKQLE